MPKPQVGQRKSDRPAPKRTPRGALAGSKPGRQPFEPTAQQRATVKMLAIANFSHPDIRKAVINPETGEPISKDTLELHFRAELDRGFLDTAALVMQDFTRKLTGGSAIYDPNTKKKLREEVKSDTKAQIFFFNSRLKGQGWTNRLELTGKNGGSISVENIQGMPDEVLDALIARLQSGGVPPDTSR